MEAGELLTVAQEQLPKVNFLRFVGMQPVRME
jgi:hypothetical protein